MYIQGVENVYDLDFNGRGVTYGDVFLRAEREYSAHNFEHADIALLMRHFADAEGECHALVKQGLALPAYDQCIKASHRLTCSTRAGRSASPSAPPISAACAPWRSSAAKRG
jgi:glycyl-tRNA synthetase alpha chain